MEKPVIAVSGTYKKHAYLNAHYEFLLQKQINLIYFTNAANFRLKKHIVNEIYGIII